MFSYIYSAFFAFLVNIRANVFACIALRSGSVSFFLPITIQALSVVKSMTVDIFHPFVSNAVHIHELLLRHKKFGRRHVYFTAHFVQKFIRNGLFLLICPALVIHLLLINVLCQVSSLDSSIPNPLIFTSLFTLRRPSLSARTLNSSSLLHIFHFFSPYKGQGLVQVPLFWGSSSVQNPFSSSALRSAAPLFSPLTSTKCQ